MKKALLLAIIAVFCIVSLTACSSTEQFFVFGTFLDVTVEGAKSTAELVHNDMADLERLISPTVEGSDLYKINNAKAGEIIKCSDVTMELLNFAKIMYNMTDGIYDPTVYPLVKLWGFSGDKFSHVEDKVPPTDEAIQEALSQVGLYKAFDINFEKNTVTKRQGYDGAMLDFGGLAKGYAVDKSLAKHDKKMLLNLGGNIGAKGKDYTIGIGNPRESETAYFGSFTLKDSEMISTSGDYERCFFYEGERFHHIIDPRTGKPADSGLISVSVVCKNGAYGDALSTAIMVLGAEYGKKLLTAFEQLYSCPVKVVFIYENLTFETFSTTNAGAFDFQKK